jgi:hypothetical protein
VTFDSDCVKIYEDFTQNFDGNGTGCCITTEHRLTFPFSPWNFLPKHLPYFSLLPRLNIILKGHHSHTTEVIEAESQAVLNTFTEHDFLDAFKKSQKSWKRCIRAERDYFEVNGGQ